MAVLNSVTFVADDEIRTWSHQTPVHSYKNRYFTHTQAITIFPHSFQGAFIRRKSECDVDIASDGLKRPKAIFVFVFAWRQCK